MSVSKYDVYNYQSRVVHAVVKHTWHGYYNGKQYHSDHKYSIFEGARNNVPLEIISCRYNLELLTPKQNRIKGRKCSITLEQLYENYIPDEKLSALCQIVENKIWIVTLNRWKKLADDWRKRVQSEIFKTHSRNRRQTKIDMEVIDLIPPM